MNRRPRMKQRAVFGPARSPPVDQSEERTGRKGEESKGQRREGGLGKKIKWEINREGKSVNGMQIAFKILLTHHKNRCCLHFLQTVAQKRGQICRVESSLGVIFCEEEDVDCDFLL